MSILSDINKTINDADMLLWYKEEYIPFVMDHLDDAVELPYRDGDGICYYMAYIPLEYHPKDVSYTRETCIEWLLNNDKIRCIVSTDDTIDGKYCYSSALLDDSGLISRIFNAYWLKMMSAADNRSKNMQCYVNSDSVTDPASRPYTWTMKVDYSNNMKPELTKVYYPMS
jgi:hypothetical protein